jgi:predicted alpha/beta superfamily hydrolase
VDFIVKTLRPYINKNYRTKKCRKHTFTAGSSMGGLISLYALLKYPKVFGGAGVFSPALWIAPQLKTDIAERSKKIKAVENRHCRKIKKNKRQNLFVCGQAGGWSDGA